MAIENYGTFVKDGREKVARSRGAAVRYRFNGWTEKSVEPPASTPAASTSSTAATGDKPRDEPPEVVVPPPPRRSDK